MASPSDPPFKAAITNAPFSLPSYLSETTANIAQLNRLLSNTATLDTTLLTTTYTLHLLHSLLPPRSTPHPPASTLSKLRTRIAPLAALLDEFRILLRLWGLLGIYTWAASLVASPPKDKVLKAIAWAQVTSIGVYQALENGAFLSAKGVMGWDAKMQAKAWLWGSRAWMLYTGLELGRLGYQWRCKVVGEHKGRVEIDGVEGEKAEVVLREEKVEREQWWRDWQRGVGVNLGYAPMTVHYSMEEGLLSEGVIGVLGVVVAWFKMGEAWRASA